MSTALRKIQMCTAKLILCGYFILFATTTFSAPLIEIRDDTTRIDLPTYTDVFEDKTRALGFDEIRSKKYFQKFAPLNLTDLFFGYTHSVYWLRFVAQNQTDHDQNLIFEVTPADIDFVDFYAVDHQANKILFHKRSGSAVNFEDRDYNHPLYYFDLRIPSQATYTYYVRLQSDKTINAQLSLSSPREHFYHSGTRDWWQGFLLGSLLLLGLLHIVLAFVFNYKGFAYCGLVLLSMLIIQCSWNGYFLQFTNTNPTLLDRQLILSVYVSTAFGLLFARSYFNTHQRTPAAHRMLTILIVISLMGVPCSWLFEPSINAALVGLVTVPTTFVVFFLAIYSFLEGYKPARYFLVVRSINITLIMVTIFSDQGLLPQRFTSQWALSAMALFEGFVFLFVMLKMQIQKQKIESLPPVTATAKSPSSFVPIADFCHELRNPISGVIGMSELLLDTALADQQRLHAITINMSGKALLGIVNKLSDYALLESGQITLNETAFEILSVVESCVEKARNASERRNIELIYQVDENLAGFVRGDENALQQVLSSLIDYGMRHLESGEILLTVKSENSDAVLFEITSGKNTLAEEHTTLYESQQTVTSADSLNLTMARHYVALMGGELQLQQRSDRGMRALFRISLRKQKREQQPEADDNLLEGKRLMVVDDNDTCCKIIKQQASHWRMDVVVASSGKEALALMQSHAQMARPFDLLLIDYDMPGMSGLELAARVRREQEALKSQNTLIMILTGVSKMPIQSTDERLVIDQVLYKPLSGKSLKRALTEALQKSAGMKT